MPRPSKLEPFILQAALHALEHQRERVNEQIAAIRAALGRRPVAEAAASQRRPRRPLSAAARARMAAAQRRRWAEFRQLRQAQAEASLWYAKIPPGTTIAGDSLDVTSF